MNKLQYLVMAGAASMMLTACVDNTYDLSDLDTTTEIKVDNLVLPINLEEIRIDNLISLEDNSTIKVIEMNGGRYYAVSETGSFSSDPVKIGQVKAPTPTIAPTSVKIDLMRTKAPGLDFSFPIGDMKSGFSFRADDVDDMIASIESIATDGMKVGIVFSVKGIESLNADVRMTGVQMILPKGLVPVDAMGEYDPKTGVWKIPSLALENGKASVEMEVSGITVEGNDDVEFGNGVLDFNGNVGLLKGDLEISLAGIAALPKSVEILAEYNVSDIVITSFSGELNVKLEGLDIDPVSLSEIPDFFSGEGNNILLGNPQLYLYAKNPLHEDNLSFRTGLTITSMRDPQLNIPDFSYSLDNGYLVVDKAESEFVLAPDNQNLSVPDGFKNPEFVKFSGLGNILGVPAGSEYEGRAGFPDKIKITLDNPELPLQKVENFRLDRNLDGIDCRYELLAPLSLKAGSVVAYTKDIEDIFDFDEDIDIDLISIEATAVNSLPVSLEIDADAIDENGNVMNGITITGCRMEASTTGAINLKLEGNMKAMKDLRLVAVMRADSDGEAFSPDDVITLNDVRITVNGRIIINNE